jgi:hypothetical protein
MSHRKCARDFGVVLFLIGFLSCIPGLVSDSMFLGLFHVNGATNALHIVTGLIGFGVSRLDSLASKASKFFFQIFGLIYGVFAVLGFGYGDANVLDYFANNMGNTWLHLGAALLSLYLGFLYKPEK